jgi:hypothetical protein
MIINTGPYSLSGTAQPPSRSSSASIPLDTRSQTGRTNDQDARISVADASVGSKLADALWTIKERDAEASEQAVAPVSLRKTPDLKAEEFLSLSKMTFSERVRFFFLKDREITEGQLKAMTPEEREVIEAQIRMAIEEALELKQAEQEAFKGNDDRSAQHGPNPALAGLDELAQDELKIKDPVLALWDATRLNVEPPVVAEE